MMKLLIALTIFIGSALAQTPIPSRPLGWELMTHPNPSVVLEVVYDHLCDDSMYSWPDIKKVKEYYADKPMKILIHIFPLPNHHNAFFMQKAGEVVRNFSQAGFMDFLDQSFAKQNEFLTGAVNLNEAEVKEKIAQLGEMCCKVPKDMMLSGLEAKVIDNRARVAWKYAAHRGITGTPQFIINGVHDPNAPDYKYEDWTKLIDGMMSAS